MVPTGAFVGVASGLASIALIAAACFCFLICSGLGPVVGCVGCVGCVVGIGVVAEIAPDFNALSNPAEAFCINLLTNIFLPKVSLVVKFASMFPALWFCLRCNY